MVIFFGDVFGVSTLIQLYISLPGPIGGKAKHILVPLCTIFLMMPIKSLAYFDRFDGQMCCWSRVQRSPFFLLHFDDIYVEKFSRYAHVLYHIVLFDILASNFSLPLFTIFLLITQAACDVAHRKSRFALCCHMCLCCSLVRFPVAQ